MTQATPAKRQGNRTLVLAALFLVAIVMAVMCSLIIAQDTSTPKLFRLLKKSELDMTPKQQKALDQLNASRTTVGVQLVRFNADALSKPTAALNLASDVSFKSTWSKPKKTNNGETWFGRLDDPTESAVLVYRKGNCTGTIRAKGKLYAIRPIGGGLHAIVEQDESKFPADHPKSYDKIEKKAADKRAVPPKKGETKHDAASDANPLVLRLLVAYTPAVDGVLTDIDALITLAIQETNLSYQESNVNLVAELARAVKVEYKEKGFDTDLDRLTMNGDGILDQIHGLRDRYKRDIVLPMIKDASACGLARDILADETTAFAVVHYECATGYYSFGHEIGHLQGARHNPQVDPSATPFAYGHGFFNASDSWRTVMSYNCPGNCTRIPYWSNPNVKYGGDEMGTTNKHHNARVLNETAPQVTSFRD